MDDINEGNENPGKMNKEYDICEVCLVRKCCKDIECHDSKDKPSFVSDLQTILRGNY